MRLEVLFVCTGNVCRSPMAELLMRGLAAPGADLVVSSAGTQALVGEGVDPPSATALRSLGIDASGHVSRQFEPWMAAYADLILTAERAHRDVVMTEVPRAFRRTFTMREFARLVADDGLPAAPPAEVVSLIAARRGSEGFVAEHDDDVTDPYRADPDRAGQVAQVINGCVIATLDALGLRRDAAAPEPARPRPRPYRDRPRPRPRPDRAP